MKEKGNLSTGTSQTAVPLSVQCLHVLCNLNFEPSSLSALAVYALHVPGCRPFFFRFRATEKP